MMIVVLPDCTAPRISVQVRRSNWTVSGACACAGTFAMHIATNNAAVSICSPKGRGRLTGRCTRFTPRRPLYPAHVRTRRSLGEMTRYVVTIGVSFSGHLLSQKRNDRRFETGEGLVTRG